jgi:hypothetical protein
MLQEANDQHAGQIEHLEFGESEYSIAYPSQDYDVEPRGQKFRQYTTFVSVCNLKFLNAISDGRIMTAPIQDARAVEAPIQDAKAVEPEDFFSGDDSLSASFDLDAAIQDLKHGRDALSPRSHIAEATVYN